MRSLWVKKFTTVFAVQYRDFAAGSAFHRGYRRLLPAQVNPVVNWYRQNKTAMDIYIKHHPDDKHSEMWSQFKEMFIDNDCLSEIMKITEALDIGPFAALAGRSKNIDLYSFWKSNKKSKMRQDSRLRHEDDYVSLQVD